MLLEMEFHPLRLINLLHAFLAIIRQTEILDKLLVFRNER